MNLSEWENRPLYFAKKLIQLPNKMIKLLSIENSYYPDRTHKSFFVRTFEMLGWIIKYKDFNKYYYLYGFDVKDSNLDVGAYQDITSFTRMRNHSNNIGMDINQVPLLRDKFLFYKYLSSCGLRVPEVFAVYQDEKWYDNAMNEIDVNCIQGRKQYFFKAINGQCGDYVHYIENFEQLNELLNSGDKKNAIAQETVIQHPEMHRLNPCAVNTIRIVTVCKHGTPTVFCSILRVGTSSTGEKDNTSQGGIAVGINEDGSLFNQGIRKPQWGGVTEEHPNTHVKFSDFVIPYYREAVELVLRAHTIFYQTRSIGWDVAITENGPVIIEGNDDWELQSFQAIYGGLRKKCQMLLNQ